MTPLETTLHALALEARLVKAEKTIAILKEANAGLAQQNVRLRDALNRAILKTNDATQETQTKS